MAEQAIDLRLVVSGLRRRYRALIAAAVLGASLGMASVFLWPPMYASSALVLLPPKAADPNQMAELVKTDIKIATSDSVLGPAARSLPMSVEELSQHVDVTAVTPLILQIQGRAEQPQRAEDISAAVADADVAYLGGSLSSAGSARRTEATAREKELSAARKRIEEQIQATTARLRDEDPQGPRGTADATALARLTAQQGRIVLELQQLQRQTDAVQPSAGASVIQPPSPAERPGLVTRLVGAMLVGALVALLLTGGAIAFLTRRDPRIHLRDDIADAVGSPVIASVRTRARSSVADWISLLHDYAPEAIDAWTWRRALRQLDSGELPANSGNPDMGRLSHPRSITVITLSADQRGLATGPELAAYAASAGVRTHLIAAQGHETAAALWGACSSFEKDHEPRPGFSVDTGGHDERQADLTVVLAILDRHEPKLLDVPANSAVVLAVSAGSATAEELARAAMSVDEAGERIHGVVVVNPDNLDRTTGRLLQHDRLRQPPLPVRLTGYAAPRALRDAPSGSQRRPG